jgi:hypothetical protein
MQLKKWSFVLAACATGLAAIGWLAGGPLSSASQPSVTADPDAAIAACVVAKVRAQHGDRRAAEVASWLAHPTSAATDSKAIQNLAALVNGGLVECVQTVGPVRRVPLTTEERQRLADAQQRMGDLQ